MKYQTKTIVVPAGTAPGTIEFPVELDSTYPKCTGVVAYEQGNSSPEYRIGLSDDHEVYHHLTDRRDWQAGPAVPLNERYKNIAIPVRGQKITVKVAPVAALTENLAFDLVFRLEK